MAVTVAVDDAYGRYYYINSSSSREVLTWEQMKTNATYFRNYINDKYPSWSINAIAGMLGNIQSEGALNPSQWQYGLDMSVEGGFGLVQWTPATKYLNWCTSLGIERWKMSSNIDRLEWERANGEQYYPTSSYPISFSEFLTSDADVEYLASAWLYNYERPKDTASTEALRKSQAKTWLEYLNGQEPDPPGPNPPDPYPPLKGRKGMPIWMYPGRR